MKQVFLSYARLDSAKARRLVRELSSDGRLRIWFDREEILPGMRWRPAIRKAIRESDYFIALLSKKSVTNRGIRHVELRAAIEILDEFPDDQVFLIPARLDECPLPIDEMGELDYADLFPRWADGLQLIRKSLGIAAVKIPPPTASAKSAITPPARPKTAAGRHYKVALIDLDGRLPELGRVARGLSRVQKFFGFTAAIRSTPRTARKTIDGSPQFYLDGVPDSFYTAIAPMNVDFAVCLTKGYIAFQEKGRITPNFLASPSVKDERIMFVTYAGLRAYAEKAGIRFESALAFQVTSQLVAYFLEMNYHDATRGCPLDFCDNLDDLVEGLQAGQFCSRCAKRLRRNRDLQASVNALIAWGRPIAHSQRRP